MASDPTVLEMLCSKICHDLISPVGAIHNGVELYEEMGASGVEDAMGLIAQSVKQANRRLKIFRFAYGSAGSRSSVDAREVRKVCFEAYEGSRAVLEWAETDMGQELIDTRGLLKTVVCLIMLGGEMITRAGVIKVKRMSDGGYEIIISGEGADFRDGMHAALDGTIQPSDLAPQLIHAYMTGQFARAFDMKITVSRPADSKIHMVVKGR